ncbi:MAG: ribosomal protection-like ABC-F family protein [Methanomassiliicoccales archaeon]
MLLRAQDLTKSFEYRTVLDSIDLQINEGDRKGLIGVNGMGKSTLLEILSGRMKPDLGEVHRRTERIGYLPQFPEFKEGESVLETIRGGGGRVDRISKRMEEIEGLMAQGDPNLDWKKVAEEYSRLREQYESIPHQGLDRRERDIFDHLDLPEGVEGKQVSRLSGGERTKVTLAKLLIQGDRFDLLLLDEPTSHLDIESVEWLENHLLHMDCALVLVSHDRYFLDNVVTSVMELEDGRMWSYSGNYTTFVEKKAMDEERKWKEAERNRIKRQEEARKADNIHRESWFGSAHKTRLKMLEKMDQKEKPARRETIEVDIGVEGKAGRNMITARGLGIRRGGDRIVEGLDLEVKAGDKMGLFGPNGSGKTSLLQAIMYQIPYEGELYIAPGARVGYFAQGHDTLENTLTPEEQLLKAMGEDSRLEARKLLAKLLLTGREVERPIGTLSGGERARVALAMLIADRRNLLILDEPTNHLDIPSCHAMESALVDYPGTLLIVTHDRYLLDSVCSKVANLKEGELSVFKGNYSELKGRPKRRTMVKEGEVYRVLSSFTEWESRQKFKAGDRVVIPEDEMENFQWALDTGKLRRTGRRGRKRIGG